MAWIESNQTLERNNELFLLRKALGWDKNQAVGFLHRFWWLVLEQAPNGDVSSLATEAMSETLGMGPEVVQQALELMASPKIGFLDRTTDGRLLVHEWLKYAGRFLRDSLWKRSPEKWNETVAMYANSILAADSLPTVCRQSANETQSSRRLSAVPNLTKPNQLPTPEPSAPAGESSPPPKRTATPTKEAIRLTDKLIHLMRGNDPSVRIPASLDKWQQEADRLLKIDRRPFDEASALLEWCQHDNFWRGNILSMTKFREKYTQLKLRSPAAAPEPPALPADFALREAMALRAQEKNNE